MLLSILIEIDQLDESVDLRALLPPPIPTEIDEADNVLPVLLSPPEPIEIDQVDNVFGRTFRMEIKDFQLICSP